MDIDELMHDVRAALNYELFNDPPSNSDILGALRQSERYSEDDIPIRRGFLLSVAVKALHAIMVLNKRVAMLEARRAE